MSDRPSWNFVQSQNVGHGGTLLAVQWCDNMWCHHATTSGWCMSLPFSTERCHVARGGVILIQMAPTLARALQIQEKLTDKLGMQNHFRSQNNHKPLCAATSGWSPCRAAEHMYRLYICTAYVQQSIHTYVYICICVQVLAQIVADSIYSTFSLH